MRRRTALLGLAGFVLFPVLPAWSDPDRPCAVPQRPMLCRAFHVFRGPRQARDRLPRVVRRDPRLAVVRFRSSRRVDSGQVRGHRFYLLGGKRHACIVDDVPPEADWGVGCARARGARGGNTWVERYCEPAPRRHRFVLAQALPDHAHATVHRVGKPAIRVRLHRNLLLVDLHVHTVDDVPKYVRWRRNGRLHRTRLPVFDSQASCR